MGAEVRHRRQHAAIDLVGGTATLTATISATTGDLTGSVSFSDGTTPIAGCQNLDATSRTIVCTTVALAGGAHTINAAYTGDANYEASSATTAHTVDRAPTILTLLGSPNPATWAATVTFSVTVSTGDGWVAVGEGTVSLSEGTTPLGTCLVSGGLCEIGRAHV